MSCNETPEVIQEQDRFLPIANIARIMKKVVPEEGKLSKEAKECVQECVTEFIQFVVSEASESCTNEKRKTITSEDLLRALGTLGFDSYVDVLKTYIENYRQATKCSSATKLDMTKILPGSQKASAPTSDPPAETVSELEQVQLFMDNATGQHYMFVTGPNGEQTLQPVSLKVNTQPDSAQ